MNEYKWCRLYRPVLKAEKSMREEALVPKATRPLVVVTEYSENNSWKVGKQERVCLELGFSRATEKPPTEF